MLDLRPHIEEELQQYGLRFYLQYGDMLNGLNWRAAHPLHLYRRVEFILGSRLE